MSKTAVLAIKIVSDARDGIAGLGRVEGGLGKLGKVAAVGAAAVGTAAGAAVAYGVQAVKSGAQLEQSIGAIDTVFKGSAGQMHTWAKGAATNVGLTRNEFNELGTLIGTQLKNGGTAMDQLGPKTNDLIKLGADLSAMYGGDAKTAVEALSSALKGERDPIEKYGVSLTQSAIEAEAAALGFEKVGGALSTQAQQAATVSLIMKQTKDAQGTFAKESGTAAGQQQRFNAALGTFTESLGLKLLPLMTGLFEALNKYLMPALEGLLGSFDNAGAGGINFGEALDKVRPFLDQLIQAAGPLWENLKQAGATILPPLLAAFQSVGTYVQTIASVILPPLIQTITDLIPPISEAVAAVLEFVGALYDRLRPVIEALSPIVSAVFGIIGSVIGNVLGIVTGLFTVFTGLLKGDWSQVWEGLQKTIGSAVSLIKGSVENSFRAVWGVVSSIWQLITGSTATTWDDLVGTVTRALEDAGRAVGDGIGDILDWFWDLPDDISRAVGDLGSTLWRQGEEIIQGFLRGLRSAWGSVTDFVGGIGAWIAQNKGPLDYDRKLLEPAGRAIMTGLARGISGNLPELRRILGLVTGTVADVTFDPWNAPALASTGAAGRGQPATININVDVPPTASPVDVGREIVAAIDRYRRAGGRVAFG